MQKNIYYQQIKKKINSKNKISKKKNKIKEKNYGFQQLQLILSQQFYSANLNIRKKLRNKK